MMNLFGSKKTVPEAYNSDGTMPLLEPSNKIVVSFDALGEKYNGKYKITAEKGGKTAEYVVNPNAPSENKATVEAIVSKLNGGEEKVAGPTGLQALNDAVDELIEGIADAGKINTATTAISSATGAISSATGAITVADKDAAIAKVTEAIAKVTEAIEKVNTALMPVTGATPSASDLKTALENAQKALQEANKTLNKLETTTGGYNSAKSAAPKRITRIRRTRRLTKRTGTRRRLTY
jgi:DNA repair ATPase RecN